MKCGPTKQQRRTLERVATTVKCRRLNCDLENKKAQIVTEIQVASITMFCSLACCIWLEETQQRVGAGPGSSHGEGGAGGCH